MYNALQFTPKYGLYFSVLLYDWAEQQGSHMELRQPAYWKTSHRALTFVSLSQSRQEQERKQGCFFYPTEC